MRECSIVFQNLKEYIGSKPRRNNKKIRAIVKRASGEASSGRWVV